MCDQPHTYTVEVTGRLSRYIGPDASKAVSALLTVDPDDNGEEGYVVAEHVTGDTTVYCPAESGRIENEAIAVADGTKAA